MITIRLRGTALGLAIALAACGGDDDDDAFAPTMDEVAGSYTATVFTMNSGGTPLDLLALGASVTATLNPDGTTTGHLFVPGGGPEGSNLEEDLTGTWTLSGTTVTFSQTESTFITDVDFAVGTNTLTGEGTYLGAIITLVLTRDE